MESPWKRSVFVMVCALSLWGCGDVNVNNTHGSAGANQGNNPPSNSGASGGQSAGQGPEAYFVAIQCEPNASSALGSQWDNLQTMVGWADDKGIKLTLMFAPQWADWLSDKVDESAQLQQWRQNGHEIAGLHQSVYAGYGWDGYTDLTIDEYLEILGLEVADSVHYQGSLDDWQTALEPLNGDLNSGCSGGQADKRSMPKDLRYDTCSGFSQREQDDLGTRGNTLEVADLGVNDFILEGVVASVTRHWLTHAPVTSFNELDEVKNLFGNLQGGVYGLMLNAEGADRPIMDDWLNFLHDFDQGEGSHTLKGVIDEALLPTKNLPADLLDAIYDEE